MNQCIEADGIWWDTCRVHSLQPCFCPSGFACPCTSMEDRTEAHHIWNGPRVLHLAEPFFSPVNFTTTGTCINHGIVTHDIGLNPQGVHSLEPSCCTLYLAMLRTSRYHHVHTNHIRISQTRACQSLQPRLSTCNISGFSAHPDKSPIACYRWCDASLAHPPHSSFCSRDIGCFGCCLERTIIKIGVFSINRRLALLHSVGHAVWSLRRCVCLRNFQRPVHCLHLLSTLQLRS
mmetsp:Transcript_693/g.1243  ORF Transcript_693/g.1243 Transcript_693/m.1243 type:complete len:233 (-) Transcript_693:1-699(-)